MSRRPPISALSDRERGGALTRRVSCMEHSMARRDRIALAFPPLFLRIGLAAMFIMAGLVKVAGEMPVRGEQAAILANMGVDIKPAVGSAAPVTPPSETPSEGEPTSPARGEAMPADGFKA